MARGQEARGNEYFGCVSPHAPKGSGFEWSLFLLFKAPRLGSATGERIMKRIAIQGQPLTGSHKSNGPLDAGKLFR
jgi:hypothetical protein